MRKDCGKKIQGKLGIADGEGGCAVQRFLESEFKNSVLVTVKKNSLLKIPLEITARQGGWAATRECTGGSGHQLAVGPRNSKRQSPLPTSGHSRADGARPVGSGEPGSVTGSVQWCTRSVLRQGY